MNNVGIAVNVRKREALDTVRTVMSWLEKKSIKFWLEREIAAALNVDGFSIDELAERSKLLIALGGDGTLLYVARHACRRKVPVLGVNLGSLGFLTEVAGSEVVPTLEKITAGDTRIEERMMLEADVRDSAGQSSSRYVCLNDAVINKSAFSRAIQLNMSISGQYVGTFLADGLIVSTPTGSTAHSLSAGGPIVKPTIEALIATPICPHTLAVRPLIFARDEELEIEVLSEGSDVVLTLDGQEGRELAEGERVVFRRAEERVSLVCSGERSFYEVLRTKLRLGGLAKR
jgi:NAD+ kinase